MNEYVATTGKSQHSKGTVIRVNVNGRRLYGEVLYSLLICSVFHKYITVVKVV